MFSAFGDLLQAFLNICGTLTSLAEPLLALRSLLWDINCACEISTRVQKLLRNVSTLVESLSLCGMLTAPRETVTLPHFSSYFAMLTALPGPQPAITSLCGGLSMLTERLGAITVLHKSLQEANCACKTYTSLHEFL